jgi:putative membrane protein
LKEIEMSNYRLSMAVAAVLGAGIATVHAADPKAASANPTFANPDTPGLLEGKPAPDTANVTEVVFLKQIAIGGKAEVDLGKLAVDRNSAAGVETFAQRMVKDHDQANAKVSSLARSADVDLPRELDAEHMATRGELAALRGTEFDLKYIDAQIKDHQKAVQLLIHEVASGQHAGVRQLAADTLPGVLEHLEMARALHDQLIAGTEPRRAAAASR